MQHGGAQDGEPGQHTAFVAENALLRGWWSGERRAERTEFAYEAIGPAGGIGSERPEEVAQDLSAPWRASLRRC